MIVSEIFRVRKCSWRLPCMSRFSNAIAWNTPQFQKSPFISLHDRCIKLGFRFQYYVVRSGRMVDSTSEVNVHLRRHPTLRPHSIWPPQIPNLLLTSTGCNVRVGNPQDEARGMDLFNLERRNMRNGSNKAQ